MTNPLDDLSDAQYAVARLIAQAETSKGIAAKLGMTDGNVERHACNIARLWHLDTQQNKRVAIARVFWIYCASCRQSA